MTLESVTKAGRLDLLVAAIDGIDGYESETGDVMYWDEDKIERACCLIEHLTNAQV